MNEETISPSPQQSNNEHASGITVGAMVAERYRMLSFLGQGGVSIAYKATDTLLDQTVAIKILLPNRLSNPKDILRFEREASMASQLDHPAIAKVLDFGVIDEAQPYLVMEFIDGQTLAQRIERHGQLPLEDTLNIFIQVCEALAFAHDHNVLHRDIKPSNIMINDTQDGECVVKLLDFGLAKPMQTPDMTAQQITGTGELVGSPFYMSPEQARGAQVDARSDLYSLGCSLYETLTGGPPHLGETALATILKREIDKPIAMSEASMGRTFPDALERLVTKLLQTNANDRCQSATEAATELAKIKSFTVLPAQVKAERPQERNASKVDSWLLSKWTPIVAFVILFCLSVPLFLLARVPRFTAIRRSVTASSTIAPDHQDAIPEFDSPTASLSLNSANGQAAQKKYKEAIPHYQKAIGIYKRNSQWISEDNAKALLGLALCYQALGQYDASAQTLRQALPVYEKLRADKPELFAFHLSFIGSKYMLQQPVDRKHAWDVAEPLYKQSISIQEKLPDPTGTRLASLLYQQAQACFTCALYSDAQARYERSLALFRKASHNDNKTRVEIISSLVDTYARLHRCDRVQPLCQELLSTYDRCTDTEKKGATTDRLVQSATTCRDCALNSATPLKAIRQAGLLLEAVRQYYEKSETPPDQRVAILEKIGFTYTLAGDYGASGMLSQSEKTCRTALELRRQTHDLDSPAAALLFHELSNICRLQKRYTEAAALAKRAIDISKKNPGRKSLEFALALNGLAYVYLDQNDLAKAEPMYQQGLQICKNLEQLDSLTGVALLSGLATCKQRVGRDSEAIALFEQARRYYKTNFGPVCPNLKSLDQALARMRRQSNNNVTPSGR